MAPRAMVLAAGRGERMRPLTDTCPKPMLLAGGQPLIAWHLQALQRAGVQQVVVNHAHLGGVIEQGLGDGSAYGLHIQYSPEATALETAGGIKQALPLLGNHPFAVVNGDVYTDMDFSPLVQCLRHWPAHVLAHVVLVPNPPHNPSGDFGLSADGVAHAQAVDAKAYTFSGIGLYHPSLFAEVPAGQPAKLAPLLRQAMAQGQVTGELYTGVWLDIGTPQRLNELNVQLSARNSQEVKS